MPRKSPKKTTTAGNSKDGAASTSPSPSEQTEDAAMAADDDVQLFPSHAKDISDKRVLELIASLNSICKRFMQNCEENEYVYSVYMLAGKTTAPLPVANIPIEVHEFLRLAETNQRAASPVRIESATVEAHIETMRKIIDNRQQQLAPAYALFVAKQKDLMEGIDGGRDKSTGIAEVDGHSSDASQGGGGGGDGGSGGGGGGNSLSPTHPAQLNPSDEQRSTEFRPQIGVRGTGISFVRTGLNPHPKLEGILQGLSNEPSSDAIRSLAEYTDATTKGDLDLADKLLKETCEILNKDIGGNIFAMGLVSLAEASKGAHFTWGSTAGNKSTAGSIGGGVLEHGPRHERRMTSNYEDLLQSFKAAEDKIVKGEGANLPKNYIDSDGTRAYEISHDSSNTLLRRIHFQVRLQKAVLALTEQLSETASPGVKSKLDIFKTTLEKELTSPKFDIDRSAKIFTPIDVLVSIFVVGVHAGSNALLNLVDIFKNPWIVDDDSDLGHFMQEHFVLPDNISPMAAFTEMSAKAQALRPPNPEIDWAAAGLPLDQTGRFIVVNDKSIVNLIVRKLQKRFSHRDFYPTRAIFTGAIFDKAKRGLITVEEFKHYCQQMEEQHVHHTSTATGAAHIKHSGQAFGAMVGPVASPTPRQGGRQLVKDGGKGKGKGDGGKGGKGKGGKGNRRSRSNSVGPKVQIPKTRNGIQYF